MADIDNESFTRRAADRPPEYTISQKEWSGPNGTLASIIKAQRRIKGVIVSVDPETARIASEYGEFRFNLSSVKVNNKFPDRAPQAGDRCEFKVSDSNPPKATSIRIAIPKSQTAEVTFVPGPAHDHDGNGAGVSFGASSYGDSSMSAYGGSAPSSLNSGLADFCNCIAQNQWNPTPFAVSATADGATTTSSSSRAVGLPQPASVGVRSGAVGCNSSTCALGGAPASALKSAGCGCNDPSLADD